MKGDFLGGINRVKRRFLGGNKIGKEEIFFKGEINQMKGDF